MPRKGAVPKRDVLPDPIHESKLVTRLINQIMVHGKKVLPRKFFIMHLTLSVNALAKTQWTYSKRQ